MGPERWLFTTPLRMRSSFRWVQADQELDDELRDHLERKNRGIRRKKGGTRGSAAARG